MERTFWQSLLESGVTAGAGIWNNSIDSKSEVSISKFNAESISGVVKFVSVLAGIYALVVVVIKIFK